MSTATEQSVPDPLGMDAVREKCKVLQDAINEIGSKLSGIMSQQEEEFLSAYQHHLANIRSDFQSLRLEMEEKEAALASNDRIKKLELERDWYRREALHLDKQIIEERKEAQDTKHQLEEIKFDRDWLSKQLKSVMKERNALQEELATLKQTNE